jgi:hypothetical protein
MVLGPLLAGLVSAGAAVSLAVTPATVVRGHTVVVHGSAAGCPAGDAVVLLSRAFSPAHEFAGVPAVLTPVHRGGAFRVTTRIPVRRAPGRYVVTARCGGGNLGVSARLTVRR